MRLVQYANQDEESQGIAGQIAAEIAAGRRKPSDFAIFYRVNALSRSLERALREAAVPYQMIRGQEFYQRKEIKDVLAYCQLINNPRDDQAVTAHDQHSDPGYRSQDGRSAGRIRLSLRNNSTESGPRSGSDRGVGRSFGEKRP